MEKRSCDCCVNEPDDRNMPVLGSWSQSGCVWDASSDWGGPEHRYSMELEPPSSLMEPTANLPGFMKSQSHVICPVSKKPLITEGAAGLCCGRAKGTLRKVSELRRGPGEQKIPEWERPSGEGAWSPERTQLLGSGSGEESAAAMTGGVWLICTATHSCDS